MRFVCGCLVCLYTSKYTYISILFWVLMLMYLNSYCCWLFEMWMMALHSWTYGKYGIKNNNQGFWWAGRVYSFAHGRLEYWFWRRGRRKVYMSLESRAAGTLTLCLPLELTFFMVRCGGLVCLHALVGVELFCPGFSGFGWCSGRKLLPCIRD